MQTGAPSARKTLLIRALPWLLAAFSGLFLWSAYPPWEESGNAWFALAPLLALLRQASPSRGFRLGLVSGLAFWFPALSWLWRLCDNGGPWLLVILGHAALSFYCALYTGVFAALVAAAWQRTAAPSAGGGAWRRLGREGCVALFAALLWSGLELLRSTLLTGFAWNHLGVSQASSRAVLQLAALGGVYLVSALVMLVNATLANAVLRLCDGIRERPAPRWHLDLLLALGAVAAAFVWGAGEIRRWEAWIARGPVLTVGSVQPNAPSIFERDEEAVNAVTRRLTELTARVALFHPDLVVWPETALPGVVPRDADTMAFAADNAHRAGCPLLAGAVEVEDRPGRRPLVANASWLFQPDGSVSDRYRKQHLVPFGEFIPLDRWFPWLERLSPIGYSCTPGQEGALMPVALRNNWSPAPAPPTALGSEGGAPSPPQATHIPPPPAATAIISPLICFEDTVAPLSRKAVRAGATVLVNQSNDAWFHGSSEGRQHHLQAIFRAVENRTPLVRCANAGYSALVDPTGLSGRSADYFVLPLTPRQADWPQTPYTRWGDLLFGWPCVALGLAAALRLRRPRRAASCSVSAHLPALLAVFGLGLLPASAAKEASDAPVVILYGETSVQPADRPYSRAMARNLSRWLDSAGLPSDMLADTQAAEALASPRRQVAHLVNLLEPPAPVLQAIDRFLARNGKLVVYNSASPALAARLGLSVGPYRRAPAFHAWTQFRFTDAAPPHTPARVRQASAALQELAPADPSARVIAWWEDREGRRTPYPAWFAHPNGFWMSHVLLADADARSRRELLAALSGACAPALWRTASDTLHQRIGSAFGAAGFDATVQQLRDSTPPQDAPAVERILREAHALHAALQQDRRQQRHAAATAKLWHLELLLTEAGAIQQHAWQDSLRAVWDHGGFGLFPGDWEKTCATLQRFGITDLFLLVATPTTAHAEIPGLAPSPLLRDYGDQLAAASAAARRHQLRIHAWISVLKPMLASREDLAALARQGLLLGEPGGRENPWLDPRHPGSRARLLQTVQHLVRQYPIDGIHLDYIRYPDLRTGLDSATRAAFERAAGRKVPRWPDDVLSPLNPLHREFTAYRAGLVADLVAHTRRAVRAADRPLLLSAAVFGRHPLCADSVGQDWVRWLRDGSLDWAVPMNYTADPAAYARLLEEQARHRSLRGRILSGIGVTAAECKLDAMQVVAQIQATRQAGLGGYALFDLDATLQLEILPFLRLGVQRR